MRYRLRTLLILMAVLPPLMAVGWSKYAAWKAEQERLAAPRVPGLGPTPIAFDFAFPTTPPSPAESEQEFSFFFGISR